MELTDKKTFKQTEVGLIPQDWILHQVIDLIDLLTDFDANGSFASVAENVKVYDYEKFAWYVRSTDLEKKSNLNDVKYVDKASYRFLKKTALYGNELLFLKRGDIGNVYLFKMRTKYATVAPNLYLLKLNNVSDSTYLYYYFISNAGQSQLKSKNASSTLGALYKNDVKAIYVPLPPTLEEQKAIATALSDVDALISNLDTLITKKKAIKQGAMQQLLTPPHKGGKRLDGFTGVWVEKEFGEICNSISSGSSETNSISGIYPIYGSTGVIGTKNYSDYHGEKLLIARVGANAGTLYKVSGSYCVSDNTLMIAIPNFFDINFVYYYLKKYNLSKLIFGSGQPLITGGQIKKIKISIPRIEEQQVIAEILSELDLEIEQLETKKSKYQVIKQGMMQELLTGKTRLV